MSSNFENGEPKSATGGPRGRKPATSQAIAETAQQIRQVADQQHDELQKRHRFDPGTPETHARIESVPSRRLQSPLNRMLTAGKISRDQLAAAERIAFVIELIQRSTSVRSASLEARIDYSGSARDVLVEGLNTIRAEAAYSAWRQRIPVPKAMIIDMVTSNTSYVAVARKYGLHYRTARKRLLKALDLWQDLEASMRDRITAEDAQAVHEALGGGRLACPPQPKGKGENGPERGVNGKISPVPH